MPYVPDSPNTGDVPQPPAQQSLNKLHVISINITLRPGDPSSTDFEVRWAEGYDVDGAFKPVKTHDNHFEGMPNGEADADVQAALSKVTTGGSVYGEVKTAIWELLQAKGLIGSGSVS